MIKKAGSSEAGKTSLDSHGDDEAIVCCNYQLLHHNEDLLNEGKLETGLILPYFLLHSLHFHTKYIL